MILIDGSLLQKRNQSLDKHPRSYVGQTVQIWGFNKMKQSNPILIPLQGTLWEHCARGHAAVADPRPPEQDAWRGCILVMVARGGWGWMVAKPLFQWVWTSPCLKPWCDPWAGTGAWQRPDACTAPAAAATACIGLCGHQGCRKQHYPDHPKHDAVPVRN